MSLASRPKRRAAVKAVKIIEISDDEDSEETSVGRRKRQRLDEDYENQPTTIRRQRWPTKQVNQGDQAVEKQTNSQRKKNDAKQTKSKRGKVLLSNNEVNDAGEERLEPIGNDYNDVILIENDANDADNVFRVDTQFNNTLNNNNESRVTTGRNSFWARRKVWTIDELLAETTAIEPTAARNIVQLFENENTIPFICRYRRDLINHLEPERLREIKSTYTDIVNLRKKAETIVSQLTKENTINEEIRTEMLCAKTSEELEFLFAPYKPASKGSLAERAKALGLEQFADRLLYGEPPEVILKQLVNSKIPEMDDEEKVLTGICHIISHNISKHTGVLEELRKLQHCHRITLKTSKTKQSNKEKNDITSTSASTSDSNYQKKAGHSNKNDESKYEHYFDFQADVRQLKPHQVLAINRAEKLKFLTVKLLIADYLKNDIKRYVRSIFMADGLQYPLRTQVFERAFEECYQKKLQPLLCRQIRSDLNEKAKKASIDVFGKNLKQLLLMSPLKGERILGIDPGFTNGCKYALISETADVLETGVLYPHRRNADPEEIGQQLLKILLRHKCKLIALGNGTACRETEFWLSKLFEIGILDDGEVRYSIVSEQGASIYSCSDIAKREFPRMDTNHISAVSIARRLNDPLSEYVKIEPRHIGVGIHIAGLTEKKADKIIEHRLENGPFRTRKDLLNVKSIGEKTFVQCAGFIRIDPRSLGGSIDNLLDCTWVHPESYVIAKKIISKCKLDLKDIGNKDFIKKISEFVEKCDINELTENFNIPKERLEIVFQALQRELFKDYRSEFDKKPLFKQGLTRITELSVGDVVTGAVTNLTHFGAFVDIGVECDGLIHVSKMNNMKVNIGDRVVTSIVQVDKQRKRIGLRLEEIVTEADTSFTLV
uniref:S1 motif domain-containing protein n=1 Tax=Glossina pallidipes TaxID=7398 RepID=A0A1A9Z3R6_GLOPL